jgi:hypothetical protein
MGFYSAEADIATFISDMEMLNSFFVKAGLNPEAETI